MAGDVEFTWNVFSIFECNCKGNEADNATSCERQDHVRSEGSVIDTKAFANNDISGVSNEQHHASRIGRREFGHKPWEGLQMSSGSVIHEEISPWKDNRVVSDNHAYEGKHYVEIQVELVSIAAATIAHPEGSGLEYSRYVKGDRHICQGNKEDQDVVGLYTV